MKKLDVSKNDMLRLREQGLSNRDIAACLDISPQTVYRYIGAQGGKMEHLAAFSVTKKDTQEMPVTEEAPRPEAVDRLAVVYEKVKSAEGTFTAEFDYECNCISILDSTITIEQLPELVTFVIGLAARVSKH